MSVFQLVSALVIVASGLGSQDPGTTRGRVRTIERPQGGSIRSLLRPSDEVVIVRDGIPGPPLDIVFENKREKAEFELERLSRRENALLLVRVESVNSSLDATESWITSTARMSILEILSAGDSPLDGTWGDATIDTKNRVMTFNFDGGEIRLATTLVSAGDFSIWKPTGTYLISFRVMPEQKATHIGVVYQIGPRGKLLAQPRSRGSSMRNPDGLKDRYLADVRKLVARF